MDVDPYKASDTSTLKIPRLVPVVNVVYYEKAAMQAINSELLNIIKKYNELSGN